MGAIVKEGQYAIQHVVREASSVESARPLRLLPNREAPVEDFRAAATRASEISQQFELAALWRELASGAVTAADAFCSDDRCFVVTRATPPGVSAPAVLSARNLHLVQRVLLGVQQKVVAIELGVSASCVAGTISLCAGAMGLGCTASRMPTLVLMAVRAHVENMPPVLACSAQFRFEGNSYRVVSAQRPVPGPWLALSPAEREVVTLLVERCTTAEIATLRHTSNRTVANQLGSVMNKLGARGRLEVVSRVIEGACRSRPAGDVENEEPAPSAG